MQPPRVPRGPLLCELQSGGFLFQGRLRPTTGHRLAPKRQYATSLTIQTDKPEWLTSLRMRVALLPCCEMEQQIRGGRITVADEWYRWMIQSVAGYAIFSTDLNNRIMTWDEGAEKVFGYSRDDVLGEDARFIFTPDDVKKHVPEVELADAAANRAALDERWHVKKNGTIFWATGLMMKLLDDRRRHIGFMKIVREREKGPGSGPVTRV
jgi:PAS domain S-box-containing protein